MKEKSKGHIKFTATHEYFKVKDQVYKASINLPVMTDGYRCGRWYCPAWQLNNREEIGL